MQRIDIAEIERRAQRSFYEDGLVDILIGVYLLVFSVFTLVNPSLVAFLALSPMLLTAASNRIKERYVYPRMGYAEYPDQMSSGGMLPVLFLVLILGGVFGSFFALVWVWADLGWNLWFAWIAPISFGMLMTLGPIIVAQKLQIKRYYLYSFVMIILSLSVPVLFASPSPGYGSLFFMLSFEFSILGAIASIRGISLFLQFLHRYPLPTNHLKEKIE